MHVVYTAIVNVPIRHGVHMKRPLWFEDLEERAKFLADAKDLYGVECHRTGIEIVMTAEEALLSIQADIEIVQGKEAS